MSRPGRLELSKPGEAVSGQRLAQAETCRACGPLRVMSMKGSRRSWEDFLQRSGMVHLHF